MTFNRGFFVFLPPSSSASLSLSRHCCGVASTYAFSLDDFVPLASIYSLPFAGYHLSIYALAYLSSSLYSSASILLFSWPFVDVHSGDICCPLAFPAFQTITSTFVRALTFSFLILCFIVIPSTALSMLPWAIANLFFRCIVSDHASAHIFLTHLA